MLKYEKNDLKAVLCLSVISLAVYLASLYFDFSFIDDPVYVYNNPLVTGFRIKRIFAQSYFAAYIPLTLLSYCVDFFFWCADPFGYHLTNVIFHLLNCVLVYLVTARLTKSRAVSFFTAALFAVHPVQNQTVVWISERKSLINLFFMLISFDQYISYRETKKRVYYFSCFISFLLSILAKPLAVPFFMLLIAYDVFVMKEKAVKTVFDKIPFIAVSIIFAYITVTAQSAMGAVKMYHGGSFYSNLITIPKGALHYFRTIVYPRGLVFYYDLAPAQSIISPGVIAGLALLAALVYIMIRYQRKNSAVSLGIAIFFIFMLPVSNIIPIEIIVADRYLYVPIIGLALSFVSLLDMHVRSNKKIVYPALAACVAILSVITVEGSFSWKEKEGIWEDILKVSPGNTRAMNNLVELAMARGDYDGSLALIDRVLSIDGNNPRAIKNLALYKKNVGRSDEALELFRKALKNDPYDKEIYLEIGRIDYELKDYDAALDILRKGMDTIHEFPLDTELKYRFVLANVYVKKIMFAEALEELRVIMDISGDRLDARRRYDLLSDNIGEFNRLSQLYMKSGGGSVYKEKLEAIFLRLNLKDEGEKYLSNIRKD